MKFTKNITLLSLIILIFNLPMLSQSGSWKNTYSDVEVNFSSNDVTIEIARDYKLEPLLGIESKFEESIEVYNSNILGLNFRGTNFKPSDRWGVYSTTSLDKSFGDFKRRGTLLGKIFSPISVNKYNQTEEEDSKKEIHGYLHFLIGVSGGDENPTFLDPDSGAELSGFSSHLAVGAQINNYLGVGLGFYGISTFNPWNSHLGFRGTGININGYPGSFFYNATFGIVNKYELIDDKEYRSKSFEKEKGSPLFFEIKGGIRIAQRLVIGMGYFASSKIKGIYKEYEVPWSSNVSIFDEVRKSKISGFQFFIGFTLLK